MKLEAFLIGLGIGAAAVAVFFTPQFGEETRQAISDKPDKGKERVNDTMGQGTGRVAAAEEQGPERATLKAEDIAEPDSADFPIPRAQAS